MRVQVIGPSESTAPSKRIQVTYYMRVVETRTADVLISRLLRVLVGVIRLGNFQNGQTNKHSFGTRIILKK